MRSFDRWYHSNNKDKKFPEVLEGASLCGCCGSEWSTRAPEVDIEGIHISPGEIHFVPFTPEKEQLDQVVTKNGTLNVYVRKEW